MTVFKKMLVVRADGSMRITSRAPRLRYDEIAYPLVVNMPNAWGRVQPEEIKVQMPEPPTVTKGPKP